jgi:hypothetical protein
MAEKVLRSTWHGSINNAAGRHHNVARHASKAMPCPQTVRQWAGLLAPQRLTAIPERSGLTRKLAACRPRNSHAGTCNATRYRLGPSKTGRCRSSPRRDPHRLQCRQRAPLRWQAARDQVALQVPAAESICKSLRRAQTECVDCTNPFCHTKRFETAAAYDYGDTHKDVRLVRVDQDEGSVPEIARMIPPVLTIPPNQVALLQVGGFAFGRPQSFADTALCATH